MTTPTERSHALRRGYELLDRMASGGKVTRAEAISVMRHYPTKEEIEQMAKEAKQ